MRFYIFGSLLILLLASCKTNVKAPSHTETLKKLISSNTEVTKNLTQAFDLHDRSDLKVFKLLVSRRDRFVRITIYQIINKNDIDDLPKGYFYYKKHLFIFYDGSEILFNERLDQKELNLLLSKYNIKFEDSKYEIFDSSVLQFDIASNNKIKFNFPPINPYDLTEVPADSTWTK
jgi:hypothetical protein